MQIRDLQSTSLEQIVHCFNQAFAGYFVPLPTDVVYWRGRFAAVGVDYALSYGLFDGPELVGFILNGIGGEGPLKTAFNTGTGILPAYRGQQWVDRMYDYALPHLRRARVRRCQLEVIENNYRAIRVYERIGFHKHRYYQCFAGCLPPAAPAATVQIKPVTLADIMNFASPPCPYSWDFTLESIARTPDRYASYRVWTTADGAPRPVGYFIVNPATGFVAQLDADPGAWPAVFAGLRSISPKVKINNVHSERTDLLAYLARIALPNTVNQYEMMWQLPR